nr:hypothetical protein [Tanacetum cinerariifolium]
MRRVGKGCSGVETPLFEGMIAAKEPEDQGNTEEQGNGNNAAKEPVTAVDDVSGQSTQSLTLLTPPPQQPQDIPSTSQRIESSANTIIEDVSNQGRMTEESDKDEGAKVVNEEEETKEVKDNAVDAKVKGRQADIYHIDMDHAAKVLTPVKVVVPATRRRRGVIIRDPEEESSTNTPAETKSKDKGKGILVEEPKPMKKKQQVEMDEAFTRKLQEEVNQEIDWEVAMDHNTAGLTLDFFKEMSYDDIRPIFEAKFNANLEFLLKSKEQIEEEESRAIHLEIVPDKDDDVYTEATILARKVLDVDSQIIHVDNKPRYKIIRANDTHQLYRSFITMLKNFDRDDLETVWNIVKERFSKSKPNNFSDEYLLSTLKTMFGRPDGQDNVWKDQRSVHGQALVKSWKLLTSAVEKNDAAKSIKDCYCKILLLGEEIV